MSGILLPENLDLGGASAFAGQLLGLRGENLGLDASAVQRLSGVGLEVLVAAALQWRADGKTLEITGWSEAALQALETLGASPSELFDEV